MNLKQLHEDPTTRAVLEARASELAHQHQTAEAALGEEIVVFRLGSGRYSLPATAVREVQPLQSYTPLPITPAFVVGLINVRGRLLALLDLRPLLDLPSTAPNENSDVLVIATRNGEVALLSDKVIEVRRGQRDLAAALSTTAGRGVPWIKGVDHELTLMLDPALLLADPRLIVDDETGSRGGTYAN